MKEYYSIGEVAAIFDMDVQLLRYYDARGLLVPEQRNQNNGRRMYHFDQIYPLATIRYLRRVGCSLKQIERFVLHTNVESNLDIMTEQANALRRQCQQMMETVDVIQKKLDFVRRETPETCGFSVKQYPARQFVPIGEELRLFTSELFYFYPLVGFYEGSKKWFGAYLYDDCHGDTAPQLLPEGACVEEIPAGRYLCGYHCGPYQSIQDSIDALFAAGRERGFRCDRRVVTLNIIDQFSEAHPANYITALEARILE